jgi:aconitate decarboxylase
LDVFPEREGTGGATAALARFASDLCFEDVPEDVLQHVRKLVLDGLGCGLYGSTLPSARLLLAELRGEGKSPAEATVWGTRHRLPLRDAALANAYSIDCFESDDLHKDALIHASPVTVAPTLALAEHLGGRSGRELVVALAAGCEVGARVGLAAGYSMIKRGFHSAAVTGPFLSAVASSRFLGLDAKQTQNAIGIAGSFGSGLIAAQRGAMVKSLHLAKAADAGLQAALLSRLGFTGTLDVLEAEYGGFVSAFGHGESSPSVADDLGQRWCLLEIGFKKHMCGASTHCGIDAALELRPELGGDEIEAVDVYVSGVTLEHAGWPFDPAEGPGSARLNIPWCVGAALVRGAVTVDEFTPTALADETLRAVAARIRVHRDPDIDALGRLGRHKSRVVIRAGGRTLEAEALVGRGSHADPLTLADVLEKFEFLAERSIEAGRAALIVDMVNSVEDLDDVGALVQHLQVAE